LSRNALTSLPDAIGRLRGLSTLNLSRNSLTHLPSAVGNLQNLKQLDLGGNQLQGLPPSVAYLPEQVLEKLMLIRKLKDIGFTLNEIDTFIELWCEEDASCKNLKSTLENKVAAVNEQILKLHDLKSKLTQSLTKCNNDDCEFEKTIPSCLCQ